MGIFNSLRHHFALWATTAPFFKRWANYWYMILGVRSEDGSFRLSNPIVVGDYHCLYLHTNAEVNRNCFLLAKDMIEIGENSTLAYGVTVLTSSNPNGPKNLLSHIYPKMTAPVIIKDNVWIGANATILPGVTIGKMSVVAAGSVVIESVPDGVLVAGNPAEIKKKIIEL